MSLAMLSTFLLWISPPDVTGVFSPTVAWVKESVELVMVLPAEVKGFMDASLGEVFLATVFLPWGGVVFLEEATGVDFTCWGVFVLAKCGVDAEKAFFGAMDLLALEEGSTDFAGLTLLVWTLVNAGSEVEIASSPWGDAASDEEEEAAERAEDDAADRADIEDAADKEGVLPQASGFELLWIGVWKRKNKRT